MSNSRLPGDLAGSGAYPGGPAINFFVAEAALRGHAPAQQNAARNPYLRKVYGFQDAALLRWAQECAATGDMECQATLAQMYLDGDGTPADPDRAAALFEELESRVPGKYRNRLEAARSQSKHRN